MELLDMILYKASYGLNATKKPIIHNYLQDEGDVIYCNQNVQGGNLKHLMIDSVSSADRLYFVVTKISDVEYHTFTLKSNDLDKDMGTEIPVYKTIMQKDTQGEWSATKSFFGYAKVYYPGIVQRAIDVKSWRTA